MPAIREKYRNSVFRVRRSIFCIFGQILPMRLFRILLPIFFLLMLPAMAWASVGNPTRSEQLGDKAAIEKKWEQARDYYSDALEKDAENATLHYKYGGCLAMIATSDKVKGLFYLSEMKSEFEKAIALDPMHIDARWALVEYYLQVPAIFGGSEKKASEYAGQLSKLSEVDGLLAKARIEAYFHRYDTSEKLYLLALEKFRSESAKKKLAELYRKTKQYQKAEKLTAR